MHSLAVFTVLLLICFQDMIQHAQADGSLNCDGRVWKWYDTKVTWNVARKYCASKQLRLATVYNSNEFNNCLLRVPYPRAVPFRWIGLNDQATEGVYRWDATQHTARPGTWWWAFGEPNNYGNGQDCILIRGSDKRLNDYNCNVERAGFICEAPRPVHGRWTEWSQWSACSLSCGFGFNTRTRSCTHPAPLHGGRRCQGHSKEARGCSSGACPSLPTPGGSCPAQAWWFPGALKCYIRQDYLRMTWLQAATSCRQLLPGARMLSINSQEEQDEVSSHVLRSGSWAWFNATDTSTEAVWRQGSTPLTYTNWNFLTGEPNGGGNENCASIQPSRGGFWLDNPCTHALHVFCERDFLVKYRCGNWSSWSECTVTCGGGTQTKTRRCISANGTSDDLQTQECSAQQCPEIQCPKLLYPEHGQMHHNSGEEMIYHYGVRKKFTCDLGYELNSSEAASRTCQDSGQWTGVEALCIEIQCPTLLSPAHGQMHHNSGEEMIFHYGVRKKFTCDLGYELNSSEAASRTCQDSGKWTAVDAICTEMQCPKLLSPVHGQMHQNSEEEMIFHYGVRKKFTCDLGYQLNSSEAASRTCQESGQWTGVEAICTIISCPTPNRTSNALSFMSGTQYRSHRLSACEKGFRFHQAAASFFFQQCNIMGEWMPSALPSCRRITCPTLKAQSPLKVSHSSLGYGSVAIYSCENGYVLHEGSASKRYCTVDCQETRLLHFKYPQCASPYWNGTHPECVSVTVYSSWTACSQTCGGGMKHRFRTCLDAYLLSSSCAGPALEAEECNLNACPHETIDVPTTAEQLEQLLQSDDSTTQQAVTTFNQASISPTTSVPLVNNSNLQSCPETKCSLLVKDCTAPVSLRGCHLSSDEETWCCNSDTICQQLQSNNCHFGIVNAEHRLCQNSLNRPVDACSSAALMITDIAFIGNQKRNAKRNCTAANGVREYHVGLRIRTEIYRSPRCSFLPDYSEGRYNAIIALRYETDCPCPYIEDNRILLATASCDPERRVLYLHAYSIYRSYTKKAHKNLLARCNWKGNS